MHALRVLYLDFMVAAQDTVLVQGKHAQVEIFAFWFGDISWFQIGR